MARILAFSATWLVVAPLLAQPAALRLASDERDANSAPTPRPAVLMPPADADLDAIHTDAARLKEERDRLTAEREKTAKSLRDAQTDDAAEVARLRVKLAELITRLDAKKAKESTRPIHPEPVTNPVLQPP